MTNLKDTRKWGVVVMKLPLIIKKVLIKVVYGQRFKGKDYLEAIERNFNQINSYKKDIDNLTYRIEELLAINESLMQRFKKSME